MFGIVPIGDRVLGPLDGHISGVWTVTYTPDGRHILSESGVNSIIVWDSTTGQIIFGPFTAHSDAV